MKDMEEFFGDVYGYFDKTTNKQVYIISIDFIEKSATMGMEIFDLNSNQM